MPGPAASRSPTSSCTSTTIRSMVGTASSRSRTSGVAMLYGRFATIDQGRAGSGGPSSAAQSSCMASASTTVAPSGSTTERRTGARCLSTSMAVTSAPTSSRASVSDPRPAPTSTTRSPGPTPGQPHDLAHDVGVGHEVLAQRPRRLQPVLGQQRLDGRRGVRHAAEPCSIRGGAPTGARRRALEVAELAGAVGPLAPAGAGLEDLAALDLLGLAAPGAGSRLPPTFRQVASENCRPP